MKSTPIRRGAAAIGAAALTAALIAAAAAPAAAVPPPTATTAATAATTDRAAPTPVPVVDELADTTATQQRWLSVPQSRLVLNPYNFDGNGSELAQNSGPDLPLSNGYYAHDTAIRTTKILQTFVAPGPAPDTETPGHGGEGPAAAYSADFSSVGQTGSPWALKNLAASVTDGVVSLTTQGSGDHWGSLEQTVTVDVSANPLLTVDVPSTNGLWAVKVAAPGQGDVKLHGDDLQTTGSTTFDLAAKTGWTGIRTFTLKLFAVGKPGAPATTTFSGVSIHPGGFPDDGTTPGFADDFTTESTAAWTESSNGTTLVSNGSAAVLTLPGSDWGYRARNVTVDIDANPLLSVRVGSDSGMWALKVNRGLSGDDTTLQPDTSQSGVFTYDLAGVTGWTGKTDFFIKLYQVGKGKSGTKTSFDRLSIHPGSAWLSTAKDVTSSWDPTKLGYTASYAGIDGQLTTSDQFTATDPNAYTRQVTSTLASGSPVVAGPYNGTTRYDDQSNTITVDGADASYAIALPPAAQVRFYDSESALRFGRGGTASPTSASGYWAATLTSGTSTVGVGWAIRDADHPADATAAASAIAAIADGATDAASATWTSFWNAYLARVPMVSDFSIQRVADGGVTPEQMRHFYLQAWIGLEMNVLPATPETGNRFAQLGTGKPSMWMNGTPGTRNVASWDSLLGMQQLVYTDPENAWASFQGMMALVNDQVDPSAYEYGELGGESLPSRKAQTAWILYQATGDRDRLEGIYHSLKIHLAWEKENMRWVLHGHNYLDERDSEFVASLIFDLEYASKIARLLGHEDDASAWDGWVPELTTDYETWFFPTTADAKGKTWSTVQKTYLDSSRTTAPSADPGEAAPYRNELGQWVDPGWSFYTSTALAIDGLKPEFRDKVRARFEADYDEHKQLAGLGKFAIKAPDAQLLVYGLLDSGDQQEIDEAEVVIQSLNRDMTLSGLFSEVYYATGEIGKPVGARGVRPSLFGISNLIDNVFLANGVRTSEGDPSFVRLANSTGGVTGLSWMGKRLDVDIDGGKIVLAGDAVVDPSICRVMDAPVGMKLGITSCETEPGAASVTLSAGTEKQGAAITVSGTGFAAGASIAITLHSTPIELGTVDADDAGSFSTEVRVPKNAEIGDHTVVVSDGTTEARAGLRVLAADAPGGGTGGTGGTDGTGSGTTGGSSQGTGSLSSTGVEVTLWLALGALLAAGGGVLLAVRRRRAARER